MSRVLTAKNVYEKKFETFDFDGVWLAVLGVQAISGIWLIYGKEKNGKTWATLLLAHYLSTFTRVLYVSAEEGIGLNFQSALNRAKIPPNTNMVFTDYESIEDLYARLKRRKAPKIVVLDNLTIYNEELKASGVKKLKQDFPNILFIMVAHEERNRPYTAAAGMASKLADVIMRVRGLRVEVGGRTPGGVINIDEEKAQLIHGTNSD